MLMGAHVVGTVNVVSVLAMALVIQQALDLSATEVGLLMTAYYSEQATWSLPAGASVDRAGVGRILMLAMVGIAVDTSVVATAQGLPMLLLGLHLIGSGYATLRRRRVFSIGSRNVAAQRRWGPSRQACRSAALSPLASRA